MLMQVCKDHGIDNLPTRRALMALITINPAKQLCIDHRVGSLEVEKDGDLAIFNNHPLSIDALPMVTIVDGVVRFDREKMM